jgi:hypothetical protein
MSLWTEPPRIRQFRTLDEFPAPGLDALGATASQALYDSPLQQIQRRLEDSRARDPYVWEIDETGARIVGDKPRVDRTTAIDRAKAEGVDLKIPDEGVTEDYLQLLIKRKKEYQQRQNVIDRGPKGVVFGTAQFVSALGASLLDPLNLAASFVPVGQLVAPAMALRASQAATLGARTAARAGVGAIEGAVGQALLEPLTYYSYDQEQLDYTVVNSLQNIAFGALLGSAAHTGFGLIRDKLGASAVATPDPLNKLDPGVQQEILKIRVADLLEGKTTDVTPIVKPFIERPTVYHGTPEPFSGDFRTDGPRATNVFPDSQGIYFTAFEEDAKNYATNRITGESGAVIPAKLDYKNAYEWPLKDQPHTLPELQVLYEGGGSGFGPSYISPQAREALEQAGFDAITYKGGQEIVVFRPEQIKRLDEPTNVDMDAVARAARNRNLPEADRNADFDALRDVDNTVGPEPKLDEDMQRLKEDTDEMLRQANETAQQMNLELPELRAADELEAKLRQYIKAVNAAATCGIRG